MHFSVPDTQELIDEVGSAYLGYNVHINGLYHCTVRYKQLHNLHEQLTKDLDIPLPYFPPKKFFPLTSNQQEERRLSLDKYIQTIGQNTSINNTELLNGFLLSAQLESAPGPIEDENIDIFFMNSTKINLTVSAAENSGQVLKKLCKQIKLDEKFCSYFSLFIIYQDDENFIILRKLQDFESPIVSKRNMNKLGTRIAIGKWYWDTGFDFELFSHPVALNLLYLQATAEVERGWIPVKDDLRRRLSTLQDKNKKEEYLEIVRSLKYYGYVHFAPCTCDYPQPGSKVMVSIGKNELNLRIASSSGEKQEVGFKVTRMRCWRITTLQEGSEKYEDPMESSLELSFEYLIAADNLQWITVSSDQAILMSVCLQSMIDELLLKHVGGIVKNEDSSGKTWTYVTRDGHSRVVMGSLPTEIFNRNSKDNEVNSRVKSEPIIKKITEKFSAVKVKKSNAVKPSVTPQKRRSEVDSDLLENNAFCMIGDDDL